MPSRYTTLDFGALQTTPLVNVATPSGVTVTPMGTTGATTYGYRVSAINDSGETLACSTVSIANGNATLSPTNFNRIMWPRVAGATGYKVYGRTSGSELFLETVTTTNYWDDTGTDTPSGALPGSNTTGYNSTKLNLGTLVRQYTEGSGRTQNYLSPLKPARARPMEDQVATAVGTTIIHVVQWSDTIDYVFLGDSSTAAATRRVMLYEFNRSTSVFTYKGHIVVTFPPNTNHTMRAMRGLVYTYSTGTVAVSGTGVTGTGTAWQTARFANGARIGFGTTDPTKVTQWYEISTINSDTSITLTATGGTVAAGTPFVIEEFRVAIATTNATATNGGLFLVKGLHPNAWQVAGATISAAVTTDNVRAVFWLADNATVANTVAAGMGLDDQVDNTQHDLYVLNGNSTTARIFKYNLRASLSGLSSGKSTSAYVLETGNQTVTGNISQNNNGRIATAAHGPGSGVECFYFATTTRIYRVPTSGISGASTTFAVDAMVEVPPGGTTTLAATAAFSTIEFSSVADRFWILSTQTAGTRSYVTQYQTTSAQFESTWGVDLKYLDATTTSSDVPPIPANTISTASNCFVEGGLGYVMRTSTSNTIAVLYTVPFACHWGFASAAGQVAITPAISTSGCTSFDRVAWCAKRLNGGSEINAPSDHVRLYYRTAGISDNSGSWTLVDESGDLSGVAAASSIQFKIEWQIFGITGIPARVYSLQVMYQTDDDLPPEMEWNFSDYNQSNGTVGFRQIATFTPSVPNLQIDYYRSDTDANVLSQASTGSSNGTFEYWNGSTWTSGLGPNTVGTRRRFVPSAGLPSNVYVYTKVSTI